MGERSIFLHVARSQDGETSSARLPREQQLKRHSSITWACGPFIYIWFKQPFQLKQSYSFSSFSDRETECLSEISREPAGMRNGGRAYFRYCWQSRQESKLKLCHSGPCQPLQEDYRTTVITQRVKKNSTLTMRKTTRVYNVLSPFNLQLCWNERVRGERAPSQQERYPWGISKGTQTTPD